jgi:hypothetical protein
MWEPRIVSTRRSYTAKRAAGFLSDNARADEAMPKAKSMIEAFARSGFTKLHLDASMGCT